MIQQILTFNSDINTSLQAGDIIYYSSVTTVSGSGFNTVNNPNSMVLFGIVTGVFNDGDANAGIPPFSIVVIYNDAATPPTPPPLAGDYIMFAKNKEVNSSSLKGYFAEVKFVNYSTEEAKLFAVSSEVSESSN